jgi:hypothetical protein
MSRIFLLLMQSHRRPAHRVAATIQNSKKLPGALDARRINVIPQR